MTCKGSAAPSTLPPALVAVRTKYRKGWKADPEGFFFAMRLPGQERDYAAFACPIGMEGRGMVAKARAMIPIRLIRILSSKANL